LRICQDKQKAGKQNNSFCFINRAINQKKQAIVKATYVNIINIASITYDTYLNTLGPSFFTTKQKSTPPILAIPQQIS
jgi:hypothetical protein